MGVIILMLFIIFQCADLEEMSCGLMEVEGLNESFCVECSVLVDGESKTESESLGDLIY